MQIKRFFIVFIISIFMFGQISQAQQSPVSTTLKEGIYNISSEHLGYYRNIKLVTPDKPVTITLLDANGAQILFVKLSNEKENLRIGPIKGPETLVITGSGEISLIH
ncbi:hypothetical protein [Clostridium cellulovorans]|uniref:Uncharacterized protein n=1 Tax=Clostridium cellulovorans (strain ATCC 35296 / DSM 3052 / OCM 3 / 743B) TaxID=573061 RepID=D9ST67_CLOC7|nr:hypothetical protein [Clostridium cellulovorans]ADL50683.1 hypothetical protein Clocel_0913 [Clostridium cellulovorans 743B]